MKKIKYLALTIAACMAFAACSTDIERPRLAPTEGENYPAPTLADFADIIVNSDNNTENISFICTPVDFGQPLSVRYQLYLTKADNAVHVATSYAPTITLTKADINGTLINSFGADANSNVSVGAYVIAYAGESNIHTDPSNTVQFNVFTYRAALRKYYLVGIFNGWEPSTAPTLWETAGGSNLFAGMYNLTEDAKETPGLSGFKLLVNQAWDGNEMGFDAFASKGANITASNDGNLVLPAGMWQISANLGAMSIDATEVKAIYVTGGFCDWVKDGAIPLVYDPAANVWKSETPIPAGSEFKVVYEAPGQIWLGNTGKTADNMPEGRTAAVELGDGQNFSDSGGKYVVVYADRTPYLLDFE